MFPGDAPEHKGSVYGHLAFGAYYFVYAFSLSWLVNGDSEMLALLRRIVCLLSASKRLNFVNQLVHYVVGWSLVRSFIDSFIASSLITQIHRKLRDEETEAFRGSCSDARDCQLA